MPRKSLRVFLLLVCGLPAASPQERAGDPAADTPNPPQLRLTGQVRPTRYQVELTIQPDRDHFTGKVSIDLDVQRETTFLWLHADGITVQETMLWRGGRALSVRSVPAQEDFLGFALERPLAPGDARLEVSYQGTLFVKDRSGIFRVEEGGEWYAFTQFQPLGARRAFPCFDEPSYKVPWQLTLHVPNDHLAFSNTTALSEDSAPDGTKTVRFAETKPLPSYLVALAVGRFDIVYAGPAGRNKTPVRIIAPRGKTAEAAYAVETIPRIFELLEEYFGLPYPYQKLDNIAVPSFFGAMEHPGLVTYAQAGMLVPPARDSIRRQRGFANLAGHELAHQWLGNLVTMDWWDDLWLNEAFASWLADKIVDQWKPEWNIGVGKLARRSSAMSSDSLVTARKIRQPIESHHDIASAFDEITYAKGQAVLEMFEAWLGPETFQRGIRRYLDTHAWGNATAQDFFDATSKAAGRDVAPVFSSFLDQAGVPLVSVQLQCPEGSRPRLTLSQQRFAPLGSRAVEQQTWRIPICVQYPAGEGVERECTLLTEATARVALPAAQGCPAWILANDGPAGYYRALYQGDLLRSLLETGRSELTLAELVGTIRDINALSRSGALAASQALALVPGLIESTTNRHVISSSLGLVGAFENIIPEDKQAHYARFLRNTYGERARELGWHSEPGDDDERRLLRRTVVRRVAYAGEHPELVRQAQRLARQWLEDRGAVEPDLVPGVLQVAAKNGDRALFEAYLAEATATKDRRDRAYLLGSLGEFRDPAILRDALAVLLGDEIDIRDSFVMLYAAGGNPANRRLAYEFVKKHFDSIAARLPRDIGDLAARLPFVGAGFCDEERRADLEAFFGERSEQYSGGPRMLAQVLERVSLCIAFKEKQQADLARFLSSY